MAELELAEQTIAKRKDRVSQAAYEGFLKTKPQGIQAIKEFYNIQREIIITIERILELSESSEGRLAIYQGQLMFEEQESLDLYNSYINQLAYLAKQEEELLMEQQRRLEARKERLEDLL